jgi:hypothetical protein
MKFNKGIAKKYHKSIENAFETIIEKGTNQQRLVMQTILDSKMLICVGPLREVVASGITGVTNPSATNERIASERLNVKEALGEVFITIAEETIDGGGQRGCEGTFVHEGQHAYDFAQVIESFSNADVNPLSIFDPTLYEMEWAAHKTSGDYLLRIAKDDYLQEGLDLLILGRGDDGRCFVSDDGINHRLRECYNLSSDGSRGNTASEMFGLRLR